MILAKTTSSEAHCNLCSWKITSDDIKYVEKQVVGHLISEHRCTKFLICATELRPGTKKSLPILEFNGPRLMSERSFRNGTKV